MNLDPEQRALAIFRARHAGDPPPAIEPEPRDHCVMITDCETMATRLVADRQRRMWRGTRAQAERLAGHLARRYACMTRAYNAVLIVSEGGSGL